MIEKLTEIAAQCRKINGFNLLQRRKHRFTQLCFREGIIPEPGEETGRGGASIIIETKEYYKYYPIQGHSIRSKIPVFKIRKEEQQHE